MIMLPSGYSKFKKKSNIVSFFHMFCILFYISMHYKNLKLSDTKMDILFVVNITC